MATEREWEVEAAERGVASWATAEAMDLATVAGLGKSVEEEADCMQ